MEQKFLMKESMERVFKDELLKGNAIKFDMGACDFFEIIPSSWDLKLCTRNVGDNFMNGKPFKRLHRDLKGLQSAVKELREMYVVDKIRCEDSGCCQYSSYIFKIATA